MTTESHSLTEKAMLVSLCVRQWGGNVKDIKASKKVTDDFGAGDAKDPGYYKKNIFGGKEALKMVKKSTNLARQEHYFVTLPWLDTGWRILPSAAYFTYMEKVNAMQDRWKGAVEEFLREYDAHIATARRQMGALFNENDYPTISEVREKFSFEVNVMPLPSSQDFRVTLQDGQAERIAQEIESRVTAQFEAATGDLWERVYELVEHLKGRLNAYQPAGLTTSGRPRKAKKANSGAKKPFRDSVITNITDLIDILPALNVSGNADLDAMAKRVRQELTQHTPDELRSNHSQRHETADKAAKIMSAMSAFMGPA